MAAAETEEEIAKQKRNEQVFTTNTTSTTTTTQNQVEEATCNMANLRINPQRRFGDYYKPPNRYQQQQQQGWNSGKKFQPWRNNKGKQGKFRQDKNKNYQNKKNKNFRPREDDDKNGPSRCRSCGAEAVLQITVAATILTLIMPTLVVDAYQICDSNAAPTFVKIPQPITCAVAEREKVHEVKATLYVPKTEPMILTATRCRRVIKETCTTNAFYLWTSVPSIKYGSNPSAEKNAQG